MSELQPLQGAMPIHMVPAPQAPEPPDASHVLDVAMGAPVPLSPQTPQELLPSTPPELLPSTPPELLNAGREPAQGSSLAAGQDIAANLWEELDEAQQE